MNNTSNTTSAKASHTETAGGSVGGKIRSGVQTVFQAGETLRTNILDGVDSLAGTTSRPSGNTAEPAATARRTEPALPSESAGARSIATTSGPSAGIGAGGNPMRATGVADSERPASNQARREGAGELREARARERDDFLEGGAPGQSTGVQQVGAAIAGAAPAGPGMVGGGMM